MIKNPRSKAGRLKEHLLNEMSSQRIPLGGKLPTEVELMKRFSVSRSTVRQVLTELSIEGHVERQQGRGTFRLAMVPTSRTPIASLLVGVWFNWPTGPLYGPITEGIREELAEWGYHAVFETGGTEAGDERRGIQSLVRKGLDGFIVAPSWQPDDDHAPLIELINRKVPLVLVHLSLPGRDVDLVTTHNEQAAEEVVDHLVRLGHRRIGFVGTGGLSTTRDRLRGYRRSMRRHGMPVDESWVRANERVIEDWGEAAAKDLLSLPADRRPTAVFGVDWYIETLVRVARDRGIRVPEDLSVAGLDDVSKPEDGSPWLTTYAQPKHRIGCEAVRLLMQRIAQPDAGTRTVLLNGQLLVRESTAPPAEAS